MAEFPEAGTESWRTCQLPDCGAKMLNDGKGGVFCPRREEHPGRPDMYDVFVWTLHDMLGHSKAAAFMGVTDDPGPDTCTRCHPELRGTAHGEG